MWGGWEGFLQEVAPGLRPDSKKSHCSLMNCGSSSHAKRSAGQAQLSQITEETGSGM